MSTLTDYGQFGGIFVNRLWPIWHTMYYYTLYANQYEKNARDAKEKRANR